MHRSSLALIASTLVACGKAEPPPDAGAPPVATKQLPAPSEPPDDPNLNRVEVTSVMEGSEVTLTSGDKTFAGETPAILWVPDGDYVLRVVEEDGVVWEQLLDGVTADRKLEVPVGGNPHIVVGGRKVPVSKDVYVVGMDDPDGLDFRPIGQKAEASGGVAPFRADRLGQAVDSIVVHATRTSGSARQAFDADAQRELSCHFYLARDGTVYQALDVVAMAYHAGEPNARSVCVAFVHPLPNLLAGDSAPASLEDERANYAEARRYTVNGAEVSTLGLTPAQSHAWEALLLALLRALPGVVGRFPHDGAEVVLAARPDGVPGVVAYLHVAEQRWDIPSLDFERLRQLLVAAGRWRP